MFVAVFVPVFLSICLTLSLVVSSVCRVGGLCLKMVGQVGARSLGGHAAAIGLPCPSGRGLYIACKWSAGKGSGDSNRLAQLGAVPGDHEAKGGGQDEQQEGGDAQSAPLYCSSYAAGAVAR